jgi:hypothetical protein
MSLAGVKCRKRCYNNTKITTLKKICCSDLINKISCFSYIREDENGVDSSALARRKKAKYPSETECIMKT